MNRFTTRLARAEARAQAVMRRRLQAQQVRCSAAATKAIAVFTPEERHLWQDWIRTEEGGTFYRATQQGSTPYPRLPAPLVAILIRHIAAVDPALAARIQQEENEQREVRR